MLFLTESKLDFLEIKGSNEFLSCLFFFFSIFTLEILGKSIVVV